MDSTAVRHARLGTVQKFIILAAAAFAFLLLAGIFATPAHASVTSVEVGGSYVYRANGSSTKTVTGVSYSSSSNTLTLNNVNLSYSGDLINISGLSTDTVNVVLKGSNTLATTSTYGNGIYAETKVNISGSGLTAPYCHYGIRAAAVTIKSGTYNLSNCGSYGIYSDNDIKISGGKLNISVTGNGYALYSSNGKISNKAARLGSIIGELGDGVEFKKSGSTYQVTDYYVTLKKYGGKKKAKIDEVSFGGSSYTIKAIAAKAFKTKKGAKVKSITVSNQVNTVGKLAFAGTKKLTKLDLSEAYYLTGTGSSGVINKKAFAKCGKGGGKKLKVKCGWSTKSYQKETKKFLVKKGLSKKAKVVR